MRIQKNMPAINAYNKLSNNNNAVSKNLEKLSSGYRINRAGDDAAGLAISEKMKAQITGLETAQKNANDGISLVQTAEGALTEVHSMLNRMIELADQSANGTYDNEVDRANLQKEVESLKAEVDRISEGTNFNGINLLDGSLSGSKTASSLTGASIANFKGATTGFVAAADMSVADIDYFVEDTINVDGVEVKIDWSQLTDAEKTLLSKDWTSASISEANKAADIIQNTINESIKNYNSENGTQLSNIRVTAKDDLGIQFNFTSGQLDGSSKIELGGTYDGSSPSSVLGALYNDGLDATSLAGTLPTPSLKVAPEDLSGKFTMMLDEQTLEVDLTAVSTGDTIDDVVTKLNAAINDALSKYDAVNGLTAPDGLENTISVSLSKDGGLEFINNTGMKLSFEDKDQGEYAKNLGISKSGKMASNGGLTLQIGDTSADYNQLTVTIDSMSSDALGIAGIDISTQTGAANAVDKIKNAINTVSSTRGDLGAAQNRLEHTINSLSATTENMTAAESRIRDTDMAEEMMQYTKNNILVQAAQSMLAQANQLPQGILSLLQG